MRAVIAFLTEVGEACSDRRQEWVLLADTLGLSSTVEAVAVRRPAGATPNTLAGPFYRADAPTRADGESMSLDGRGEPLEMRLRVVDLDGEPVRARWSRCGRPMATAFTKIRSRTCSPSSTCGGGIAAGRMGGW